MKEIVQGRVSIIIAAYNAETTISETLDSVRAQSYKDLEIIVCDDASTDSTAAVVQSYTDPRVILLHNDKNLGPGLSRDRAIQAASGQWIAIVDADDTLQSNRIQSLCSALRQERDVMIFDNMLECHHTPSGLVTWRAVRAKREFGLADGEYRDIDIAAWLDRPRLVMQPLIPLEAIRATGARHSGRNFAEDTEFYLKLLASGLRLRYLALPLYLYRITPKSLSSNELRWKNAAGIYLGAVQDFNARPDVVQALIKNARKANELYAYHQWLHQIRSGDFFTATKKAIKNPILVITAVKRSISDTLYHFSKSHHHAHSRK
jgi:succinoglycan biosynthesis protein ExoO